VFRDHVTKQLLVYYDKDGSKVITDKMGFWDIVNGDFTKPKLTEENYWFQQQNRTNSVDFHFWKEFSFSFLMVFLFQYINYYYLSQFKLVNLERTGYSVKPRI